LKYDHRKDQYLARTVLEAIVISMEDRKARKAALYCIGMNKRTLQRAIKHRQVLNDKVVGEN
jgi:hypothetical protein